jgi:hypothetical protein
MALFHFRHRWDLVATDHFSDISFGRDFATREPKTQLLLKCSLCGDYKVKELSGTWDIVVEPSEVEYDSFP